MGIAKPTVDQLNWVPDGDPTKISEPSGSKMTQGWSPNEPLPAQQENWILYSISQWLKYFEDKTDKSAEKVVATLGTAAQVTSNDADYSDPQLAYDAAATAGGGVVRVLEGTIVGNLNANSNNGIIFLGLGIGSVLQGNVTVSGNKNGFRDLTIDGNISLTGTDNLLDVAQTTADTFSNTGADRNIYRVFKGTGGTIQSGGQQSNLAVSTTPFQITEAHNGLTLLVDTSTIAITLQLPLPRKGFRVKIQDNAGNAPTNPITIQRQGSQLLQGLGADFILEAAFGKKAFGADGTNYFFD
jgi:hypothetical protein